MYTTSINTVQGLASCSFNPPRQPEDLFYENAIQQESNCLDCAETTYTYKRNAVVQAITLHQVPYHKVKHHAVLIKAKELRACSERMQCWETAMALDVLPTATIH